jgi:hypothetical protein
MQSKYYLLFALLALGCNNNSKKEAKTPIENIKEKWPIEVFPENLSRFPQVRTSHLIRLTGSMTSIPIRKRAITNQELILSNSGTDLAKTFNDSTIIAYIFNDQAIELVEETDSFYKIEFEFKARPIEGYIVKKLAGKSTLFKDESGSFVIKNSAIKNPDLLPYCRVFITEKLNSLLINGRKEKNKIEYLNKILEQINTELIMYSIFVGESNREIYSPRPMDIWSSDDAALVNAVKNSYYAYEFLNYFAMYVHLAPFVPVKIDSFSVNKDTLYSSAINYNEFQSTPYKEAKQRYKLYPVDSKKAFTSRQSNKWLLNDTVGLVDISYIGDKLIIPETQIGHMYFYTILDNYIQELWPKRKEGYLIHRN